MKIRSFILCLILFISFSCKKENKVIPTIDLQQIEYHFGDSLQLNFLDFDSVKIQNNVNFYVFDSIQNKRGLNVLKVKAFKENTPVYKDAKVKILSNKPEKNIAIELINSYPHNNNIFTQGFENQNNTIYESSGLYKKSKIVTYTLGSNNFKKEQKLADNYFAEGLTILDNAIYVLTWKEKVIFELDKNTLEILKTYDLPNSIQEGWGITTDGEKFYISNGSSKINVLNKDFTIEKTLDIVSSNKIFSNLNELEFHKGYLYANVWQEDFILKINPTNGEVAGIISLSDYVKTENMKGSEVLNGITFAQNDNLLFTGKNWHMIYEVKMK